MKSATETLTVTPMKYQPEVLCVDYANGEMAFIDPSGDIRSAPKHSSAVKFWSWREGTLCVIYQSSDTMYYYEGVPVTLAWELMLAESVGAFIAKRVKPNYEVRA